MSKYISIDNNISILKNKDIDGTAIKLYITEDGDNVVSKKDVDDIIGKFNDLQSIGFEGGLSSIDDILYLCKHIKINTSLHTIWYNKDNDIPIDHYLRNLQWIDYIFMPNCRGKFSIVNTGDGDFLLKSLT